MKLKQACYVISASVSGFPSKKYHCLYSAMHVFHACTLQHPWVLTSVIQWVKNLIWDALKSVLTVLVTGLAYMIYCYEVLELGTNRKKPSMTYCNTILCCITECSIYSKKCMALLFSTTSYVKEFYFHFFLPSSQRQWILKNNCIDPVAITAPIHRPDKATGCT